MAKISKVWLLKCVYYTKPYSPPWHSNSPLILLQGISRSGFSMPQLTCVFRFQTNSPMLSEPEWPGGRGFGPLEQTKVFVSQVQKVSVICTAGDTHL